MGRTPVIRRRLLASRAAAAVFVILCAAGTWPAGPALALPPPGGTVSLLGQLALPHASAWNSDIWGWIDPSSNREYVVVGKYSSLYLEAHIVDVTVPTNPVLVKTITTSILAFDLKTWHEAGTGRTYLYVCDGNGSGTDSEVWDVTNPASPALVGNFPSTHNIFIDANGFMYLSYPGLKILELNTNPASPSFVWFDGDLSGGHDATVIGDRLYDFHGSGGTHIYDVTNRWAPVLLGSITDPAIAYHHSGWTSADEKFLFINDELGPSATPDITAWNIANPASPFKVADYTDPSATVHNSFRVGNYLYTSFYVAGFRVFDIGNPALFYLVDEYDTDPGATGNGIFEGCWGVYAFSPTGTIFASDMRNGLFVFDFAAPTPTGIPHETPAEVVLEQNYPNPFNPTTTITYQLARASHVSLTVYAPTGERIRTLVDEARPAGPGSVNWDGMDDSGEHVASDVYFYRLRTGGLVKTRRMVLLK